MVNILTGSHSDVASHMAKHNDIDAVWSFSGQALSKDIEAGAAGNLKRTWVNNGFGRDWMGSDGEGRSFLEASTEIKTVWIPYGE